MPRGNRERRRDFGVARTSLDIARHFFAVVTIPRSSPPHARGQVATQRRKPSPVHRTGLQSHPNDGAPSGIVKAVVAAKVKKQLLAIALKGTGGSFAATAPLTLTVGFPAIGDCGTTDFDAVGEACSVKSKGKKLVCK